LLFLLISTIKVKVKTLTPIKSFYHLLPLPLGESMRTILFTGFHGSGKTTLLLSLADYLLERVDPNEVIIIGTEYGDPRVDAKLFATPFCIKDFSRGCIGCTSMTAAFWNVFDEFHASSLPRLLLVESTPISHKTISDTIQQAFPIEDPPATILVIDPGLWDSQASESLLASGLVTMADFVVMNPRTPLSEEEINNFKAALSELAGRDLPVLTLDLAAAPSRALQNGDSLKSGSHKSEPRAFWNSLANFFSQVERSARPSSTVSAGGQQGWPMSALPS
jgi:G3E family GTPase